jgi:hypothetical protein
VASNRVRDDEHEASVNSGSHKTPYEARDTINTKCRTRDTTKDAELDSILAFKKCLRILLLLEKFKPLGISKYDVKHDPRQWLHYYDMSIANAGCNDDIKCIYFLFCMEQAPLAWLESLKHDSIDN